MDSKSLKSGKTASLITFWKIDNHFFRFNASHETLFTFALEHEVELCNLRAVVTEVLKDVVTQLLEKGNGTPSAEAIIAKTSVVSYLPSTHITCQLKSCEVLLWKDVFRCSHI